MLWSSPNPNRVGVAFYGKSKIIEDKRNLMIDARSTRGRMLIKLEVQRTCRINLLIGAERMRLFCWFDLSKHIWFFRCFCRTWRCENVMSCWKDRGTIPCTMHVYIHVCKQQIDSNTMCAPMFMVCALFDLYSVSFRRDIRNL